MEKSDFQYKLGHDQFKKLILEIKAVKAFNYKQFRKLTQMSNHLIEKNSEEDEKQIIVPLVREVMSFNFKQFKKLSYIINELMLTVDPNYKPHKKEVSNVKQNTIVGA